MKAMVHKVNGKRKQGRPRMKRREQVEKNMRRIGLRKEDAADRCSWGKSIGRVAEVARCIGHLHSLGNFNRIKIGLTVVVVKRKLLIKKRFCVVYFQGFSIISSYSDIICSCTF